MGREVSEELGRRAVVAGLAGGAALTLAGCGGSGPTGAPATGAGGPGRASTSATGAPPSATAPSSATGPGPSTSPAPAVLTVNGPDISRAAAATRAVALTFHGAGDVAVTNRVLDLAKSAGAGLTVFAVGQWLAADPDVGRRIVAAGHDLGNHTWSHLEMTTLSEPDALREITRGAQAVAASVGSAGLLFRPSGTQKSTPTIRAAAWAAGYHRCISYDVDPLDYEDPGADAVARRTLAGLSAGSIVSLHLGHPGTADALPAVFAGLKSRGLRAVRLTELLSTTS